jgi:hypothetical protein
VTFRTYVGTNSMLFFLRSNTGNYHIFVFYKVNFRFNWQDLQVQVKTCEEKSLH